MPADFLITWTEQGWPHPLLRRLVSAFERGEEAKEDWRFSANQKVKIGDRVYLYKQGSPPRGIFGIGHVTGIRKPNPGAGAGQQKWLVPVSFDMIVDPLEAILVPDA